MSIHPNRITTKKRQSVVFDFQGLQLQLHKEAFAVVVVPLGNWLAHRECLSDIPKLEAK